MKKYTSLWYYYDMITLAQLVQQIQGVTSYRMAKLLERDHKAYAYMRDKTTKYTLHDLKRLRELGGFTWDEFGSVIERLATSPAKTVKKLGKGGE